ncbi:flagellin, partial [Marinimicrobium sp. UBA4209]
EVEQLREEMNRIAAETSFNGQKLLDGSLGEVDLQVGDQSRQIISLEVPTMDAKNLGGTAGGDIVGVAMNITAANYGSDTAPFSDNIEINGQTVRSSELNAAGNLSELLGVINDSVSNVRATAVTETVGSSGSSVTGVLSGADEIMKFDLVNADGVTSSFEVSNTGSMEALVNKINQSADGKIDASLSDDGGLVLSSEDGTSIAVSYVDSLGAAISDPGTTGIAATTYGPRLALTSTDNSGITINYAAAADANVLGIDSRFAAGTIQGAEIVDGSEDDLDEGALIINGIEIGAVTADTSATGAGAATADLIRDAINAKSAETGVTASSSAGVLELESVSGDEISVKYGDVTNAASLANTGLRETNTVESFGDNIANIDISTQEGAQNAIDTIDRALVEINDVRAELGAANNRLDFTISNLSNVSEKTSAARSRIMDADFAAETAKLSQAQVLQQASQAMLAQANARPQQVLQLLQ